MSAVELSDVPSFYPDGNGMDSEDYFGAREYYDFDRVLDEDDVIGTPGSAKHEVHSPETETRCFNCGNEGHAVRSCPEPRNHQLIALSRSMYQFYRNLESRTNGPEPERIFLVEEWRSQRLRWVDHFCPGEIQGDLLREALGLEKGDKGGNVEWLSNMLVWGYPKGWIGTTDPRCAVRRRIWGSSEHRDEGYGFSFTVFGEDGDDECLQFQPSQIRSATSDDDDDTDSVSSTETLASRSSSPEPGFNCPKLRRWAHYETTLFSSELLPPYSGEPLPPMEDDDAPKVIFNPPSDTTFTEDRLSLWARLLQQQDGAPPPPPSLPPPPSPPPPPPCELIPIDNSVCGWTSFESGSGIREWCSQPFSSNSSNCVSGTRNASDDAFEEDMDLSD